MRAVLDCSAAVEIARGTDLGRLLRSMMSVDGEAKLVAPELIYAELGSAASKYYRAGMTDDKMTKALMADALDLIDETVSLDGLYFEALADALRLDHSIYDMFYFVLARRLDATLVSVDRKLNELCDREGVARIHLCKLA